MSFHNNYNDSTPRLHNVERKVYQMVRKHRSPACFNTCQFAFKYICFHCSRNIHTFSMSINLKINKLYLSSGLRLYAKYMFTLGFTALVYQRSLPSHSSGVLFTPSTLTLAKMNIMNKVYEGKNTKVSIIYVHFHLQNFLQLPKSCTSPTDISLNNIISVSMCQWTIYFARRLCGPAWHFLIISK